MPLRTPDASFPFPARVARVGAYGAGATLLSCALVVPGIAWVAVCTALGTALMGAAWLVGVYYTTSDECEFSLGDHRRNLSGDASPPPDLRPSRAQQLRHLSEVRTLTRKLIDAANRADETVPPSRESPPGPHPTAPIARAEQALLESVRSALARGLDREDIRTEGFEQAVSAAIAMSDLAYAVVDRMRARLGELVTA